MFRSATIPSSFSTNLPDDEVSNDAIQLIIVSMFNGLCRLTSALAENGMLTDDQVLGMHDAMTTPLDDPDLRDDDFITLARRTHEKVLAQALRDTREGDEGHRYRSTY